MLVEILLCIVHYSVSPDGKTLRISGQGEITNTEVSSVVERSSITSIIIEGNITSIKGWSFSSTSIQSIEIPSTVKSIESSVFGYCSSLSSITFNEGLISLGSLVFQYSRITEIALPGSLTSLHYQTLDYCAKLTKISVSKDSKTFSTDEKNQILMNLNKTIAIACVAIDSYLTLPSSVEEIRPHFAFSRLYSLSFLSNSKLTTIRESSFEESRITELSFPNKLRAIEKNAFKNSQIASIWLPSSLRSLDVEAFNSAPHLSSIEVDESSEILKSNDGILFDANYSTMLFVPPSKEILSLPKTVEEIGITLIPSSNLLFVNASGSDHFSSSEDGVLYSKGYSVLFGFPGAKKSTTVHKDCEAIGESACKGSSIESISFEGSKLLYIQNEAFKNCRNLSSISFPSTLLEIRGQAFYDCVSLNGEIEIPQNTKVLYRSFVNTGNISVDMAKCEGTEEFEDGIFIDSKISAIKLPPSLKSISINMFNRCNFITSVVLPNTLQYLRANSFLSCTRLKSITLSQNLQKIESNALSGTAVRSIEFPSSLESMGVGALKSCPDLELVTFPKDSILNSIGVNTFANCPKLHTIVFGRSIEDIPLGALSETNGLTNITIDESNPHMMGMGGTVYSKNGSVLIVCGGGVGSLYIDSTVVELRKWALYKCSKLEAVVINKNSQIESIGDSTFFGCVSLSSISLPPSIRSLTDSSFNGCSSLRRVSIAAESRLETIGGATFEGCEKLEAFEFEGSCRLRSIGVGAFMGCSLLSRFLLPDSVESLSASSFEGCASLANVTLGPRLRSLDDRCFFGCKLLASIRIPSSVGKVGALSFGECPSLKSVTFCGERVEEGSGDAFQGCPCERALVIQSFVGSSFCGIPVARVFDDECFVSTRLFTAASGNGRIALEAIFNFIGSSDDVIASIT